MASITSLGVGSGLDLNSIVSSLVEAERVPTESRLDSEEQSIITSLSGFSALKSAMSLFEGSLSKVGSASTYNTKSSSVSDTSVFSASLASTADTGSYSIEVEKLAQTQSLATSAASAFDSVTDEIGQGTLTIRFGTTTTDPYGFTQDTTKPSQVITVSAANGNNTVEGFRDYINDNDFGVQASIINDGNGYRLLLTSESSGAANSMELTVTSDGDGDDEDNSGLSQLAFNSNAQSSMLQTTAAQDALLNINGLEITRDTNSVTGAIDGVTLNLNKADVGNVVTLTISENSSSVSNAIAEFVEGYNGLTATINELTRYDPETGLVGLLNGDATVRSISSQLRSLLTQQVAQNDESVSSLAAIGITTQSDGTLQIDQDKLNAAIASDPQGIEALFRPLGRPTDDGVSFVSSTSETQAGDYAVEVSSIATRGAYNGGSVTNLTIDSTNDGFTIKVDGVTSGAIVLAQATYSGDDLAAQIQAQINADSALKEAGASVTVAYDSVNGELDITSNRYGSESSVEFVAVDTDTADDLGLTIGQNGADGTDVEGTINGVAATGDGQRLTSTAGDSNGLTVLIDSDVGGALGSVAYSLGILTPIEDLLDAYLESDGLISSREEGLNDSLEDIADERESLERSLESLESRLIAQFTALDILIAEYNSTSAFLTQQLANLPEPYSGGQ
jgi:flagellar hook-associated protein 2